MGQNDDANRDEVSPAMSDQLSNVIIGEQSGSLSNVSEDQVEQLLLDEGGNLSPTFENMLRCIYIRFSRSGKENASETEVSRNSSNRIMLEEDLLKYSQACNNGTEFSADEMEQIQTYFEWDNEMGLTLSGFMDMYHTQTSAEPLETWKDLEALGYIDGFDLKPAAQTHIVCKVCQQVGAELQCGRCKTAQYCSRKCQKCDWKAGHKQSCQVPVESSSQ